MDEAGQRPLTQAEALEHLATLVTRQQRRLGLELDAHANHVGAVQFRDHGFQDRVRILDLLLVEVDDGHDRLVREQEERCEQVAFGGAHATSVDGCALLQVGLCGLQGGNGGGQGAVALGGPALPVHLLLDRLEVGECQLDLEDPQVLQRIGRPRYVPVPERTQNEHDCVGLPDPGQEPVAQALSRSCTLDEATDVGELHAGRHHPGRGTHVGQQVEAAVGHLGNADVRIGRGEGVGGRQGTTTGQCVVEGGLARIGQPHESESFHGRSCDQVAPGGPAAQATGRGLLPPAAPATTCPGRRSTMPPLASWPCRSAPAARRPTPAARRRTTGASPTSAATADPTRLPPASPSPPVNQPVLGRADAEPGPQIDTFPVDASVQLVRFHSTELTALCPVTEQPDFYTIDIEYTPLDLCIESKSLKLYLRTFSGTGIFAEHLAPRIADHLAAAVGTPVTVTLEQGIRGGITTTVSATSN